MHTSLQLGRSAFSSHSAWPSTSSKGWRTASLRRGREFETALGLDPARSDQLSSQLALLGSVAAAWIIYTTVLFGWSYLAYVELCTIFVFAPAALVVATGLSCVPDEATVAVAAGVWEPSPSGAIVMLVPEDHVAPCACQAAV